jgi:putative phage-type endonuclease
MNTKGGIMDIILPEDLELILLNYDDKIYDLVRNGQCLSVSNSQMRVDIYEAFDDIYQLSDKEDTLSEAKEKYLRDFIDSYIKDKIREFEERILNRNDILEKLAILKELKLPEQRSEEWYKIREGILTASSLADAIGEGHFSTKDQLLIQKCGGPRGTIPFHIVEWGVMYEPVATKFYELMNDLTILEFGLVPHPEFKIFGASPDGICDSDSHPDYIGRMLEIKCPWKRQFTKEVPRHYWMQMQGQLESSNLEECDFLQVKFAEYSDEVDYNEDLIAIDDVVKEGYSSNNLPKGLLLAFVKDNLEGNPTIRYEYSDFYQSHKELKEWSSKIKDDYQGSDYQYDRVIDHWWKIDRYECSLVGRDRKWWLSVQPKIIDFWSDVLYYREVGIQEFLDKKNEKKTKKVKIKGTRKKKNTFEIDKAIVDKIQNNYLIEDSD